MQGISPIDVAIIGGYFALVIYLGRRGVAQSKGEEAFFLAGRKLGKTYQFFLNFGNSTDVSSAVSTASLVYQQGVSGIWMAFQLVFLNPYYWFMNAWFRRVRLVTMADLFEDRLGSRGLARFYAIFQMLSAMAVILGLGNFVTYKICAAIVLKPEAAWTAAERSAVEGQREWRELSRAATARTLTAEERAKLAILQERDAAGELRAHIPAIAPLTFYVFYTLILGSYVVAGGMKGTAINEVLQSGLILVFSVILIPAGLAAIGGFSQLGERVPAVMFELVSTGSSPITALSLAAILLVTLVQINGIIGNMGISGSARDEYAARFGAVSGTFAKRVMVILWSFCGLIALALYRGPTGLADPDAVWGTMSRELLAPGLLGLMLAGVLAANMSRVAAETMCISALFVRNVWRHVRPDLTETEAVVAGRWMIVVALAVGVVAALHMDNLFNAIQLLMTVNVPFGAAVMLMFFWRRLTVPAVWIGVVVASVLNILAPLGASKLDFIRTHPALLVRTTDEAMGRNSPVFFDSVVRRDPADLSSASVGSGRFHIELFVLERVGFDVVAMSESQRFAARFFFDAIFPFVLLIGVSFCTRPPSATVVDRFYGKMKTPVGATPEADLLAMAETNAAPRRFDSLKLFPRSQWEFTKWDRVDTIGFLLCTLFSASIVAGFWLLLRFVARG